MTTETLTQAPAFHAQHHAARIAVTLNVGAENNPLHVVFKSREGRTHAYKLLIAAYLNRLLGWQAASETNLLLQELTATHAKGVELTDIITFDIEGVNHETGIAGRTFTDEDVYSVVNGLVYWLARMTGQEAIAAVYVDEGARDVTARIAGGIVNGPEAHLWGDFNPAYFVAFNAHDANYAARW